MGWGDEVVAAGQAQRLWEDNPSRRIGIFGTDAKPRWHPIWDGNPIIATPADIAGGENVRPLISGPGCRPYIVYPFSEDTGWTFNLQFRCRDHIAKIYLTGEERGIGTNARAFGSYILIEPHTKHENFRWPLAKWQALVDACRDLTFVQHIHKDTPGELRGVLTLGPLTFRQACGVIASADLYVRSESGMCHAAAALGTPQVTIFGGCMNPSVMGDYPGQTVLYDNRGGSPCGKWRACDHCAAIMRDLSVETVERAIRERLALRRAA